MSGKKGAEYYGKKLHPGQVVLRGPDKYGLYTYCEPDSPLLNAAPDYAGHSGAHTPGPWVTEWELSKGAFCQVAAFSSDGNRVMRAAIESFRQVEDARLIAAAPDLLAEAKNLVSFFEKDTHFTTAFLGRLKAAIAKAEGR